VSPQAPVSSPVSNRFSPPTALGLVCAQASGIHPPHEPPAAVGGDAPEAGTVEADFLNRVGILVRRAPSVPACVCSPLQRLQLLKPLATSLAAGQILLPSHPCSPSRPLLPQTPEKTRQLQFRDWGNFDVDLSKQLPEIRDGLVPLVRLAPSMPPGQPTPALSRRSAFTQVAFLLFSSFLFVSFSDSAARWHAAYYDLPSVCAACCDTHSPALTLQPHALASRTQ
jgi:hypothetical protein